MQVDSWSALVTFKMFVAAAEPSTLTQATAELVEGRVRLAIDVSVERAAHLLTFSRASLTRTVRVCHGTVVIWASAVHVLRILSVDPAGSATMQRAREIVPTHPIVIA